MIIADTNIVSEFMKDAPDSHVLAWAQSLAPTALSICVVTVEEIERGLGRLPAGRRRSQLQGRWSALVATFAELIAIYDVAAAQATASLLVERQSAGRQMALADAQIAGICVSQAHELATRNVRDFAGITGLAVINPFD